MTIRASQILSRQEVAGVLSALRERTLRLRKKRGISRASLLSAEMDLIIFRLATCCGLRAAEIAGIRMRHVHIAQDNSRPCISVPKAIKAIAKNRKGRYVPLTWDSGTLQDLRVWKSVRAQMGAGDNDYFVCSLRFPSTGNKLHRNGVRYHYRVACASLGEERLRQVTTHTGRHTAISHWLAAGIPLVEVRDAAGHSSLDTTNIYSHVLVDDTQRVYDVFSAEHAAMPEAAEPREHP